MENNDIIKIARAKAEYGWTRHTMKKHAKK